LTCLLEAFLASRSVSQENEKGLKILEELFSLTSQELLKQNNPLVLLENVKGLLSHDNGETFRTIIATLDELGYDIQWQVLNSKNFGVPQNRERVFIVGHLRGTSRPEVFPIEQGSSGNLKYSGGVISYRQRWLEDGNAYSRNFSQGQRIYSTDGISQTLAGNAGGQGGKTGLYETEEMKIADSPQQNVNVYKDSQTDGLRRKRHAEIQMSRQCSYGKRYTTFD
jgi:DNA (cytosine-5)-methyltransferase 1